ncbi:MAG TPA: leucine-rich repeat domain-containing protein, partial [Bacteroidetes bacterium]|nr:leucine-rich repeat domain-containing protein [Bacteroidota bacterium]
MSELALRLIAQNKKTKNKYLDLGRCGLREIPHELFDCLWLEELLLSNRWWDWEKKEWIYSKNNGRENILSHIPSGMKGLTRLKKLTIVGDYRRQWEIANFENLPDNIQSLDISRNNISDARFLGKLTGLTSLRIGGNKISDASFLEKLTGLTSLDISDNYISDASFLGKFTGLTLLYIRDNYISDSSFLGKLTGLTSLDIHDNYIFDASFLEKLTGLTEIDLTNNRLADLAPLLPLIRERNLKVVWRKGFFTGPGEINLKGNPWKNPPPETVEKGNAAIFEYFRQKEKSGEKLLLEAKLILLGDGRAGKTSLANRLLKKPLP